MIEKKMHERVALTYLAVTDSVKGIQFEAAYRQALAHMAYSTEQLLGWQEARLQEILGVAKREVIGYKKKYWNINSDTDSSAAYPILEKQELVSQSRSFFSKKNGQRVFRGSTSGSTGTSLTFGYDSSHLAWAEASKWRGRSWFGANKGQAIVILWGRPIVRTRLQSKLIDPVKSWARNERLFDTFNAMDDMFFERVFLNIKKKKPSFIYGYGSSIGRMAIAMRRQGRSLLNSEAPLFVQYTADHMTSMEKAAAEEVFGAPVISDYGASEAPGIAEECVDGHLHVSIDCYKVEVADAQGNLLQDGDVGDFIITTLHNMVMPLIRYRIGDVGRLVPGACECGNPFPRMQLVSGKSVDLISTSYAKKVSAHYLDYINIDLMNRGFLGIGQFKLVQLEKDRFELHVVHGEGDIDESTIRFLGLLRDRLGPVGVTVKKIDEIALETTGKRRYFENRWMG